MKQLNALFIILALMASSSVFGRRLLLRPMSPREVYRVLRAAGRDDAIPEGRVITQAIAATSGFALGLTKGIGGALLYDLATSNATAQLLSNHQGYNMTAIASLLSNWTSSLGSINLFGSGSGGTTIQLQTQEICFTSRSLNGVDDHGELVGNPEGRQIGTVTATTGNTTPGTITTTNPTTTAGTNTGTGTVTTGVTGTGSGTNTVTTTSETPPAETCVVIQKPGKARRRRRRRNARRAVAR